MFQKEISNFGLLENEGIVKRSDWCKVKRFFIKLLQPKRLVQGDGVRLGEAFCRLVVSHLMERPASAFPCALHGHDFALWLLVIPFPRDDDEVISRAAHLSSGWVKLRNLPIATRFFIPVSNISNPIFADESQINISACSHMFFNRFNITLFNRFMN